MRRIWDGALATSAVRAPPSTSIRASGRRRSSWLPEGDPIANVNPRNCRSSTTDKGT